MVIRSKPQPPILEMQMDELVIRLASYQRWMCQSSRLCRVHCSSLLLRFERCSSIVISNPTAGKGSTSTDGLEELRLICLKVLVIGLYDILQWMMPREVQSLGVYLFAIFLQPWRRPECRRNAITTLRDSTLLYGFFPSMGLQLQLEPSFYTRGW